MMERPPIWESFKVKDIPSLLGTKLGDFVVIGVTRDEGAYYVVMECPVCRAVRITTLGNANRTKGRCLHKNYGGNHVD